MSNVRDLQRLRGSRHNNIHMIPVMLPSRQLNPEFNSTNYNELFEMPSTQRTSKNTHYPKEIIKVTPSKMLHKRGGSFGTPEPLERHTFNLVNNPRLSIYNFSSKLTFRDNNTERVNNELNEQLQSERRIKNNYVYSKELSSTKRNSNALFIEAAKQAQLSKNSFYLLMPIGKGGFGKVWKCQQKKTKQIFAMKEMSKAKVINKKSVHSVMNQKNFLSKLEHPFLVNMYFSFQDRQNLYLIMDYLDGGDLRYHLGNRQFFNEKQTKFFIANIILSLQYLHRQKIIHRDLKPQNLVFDSQGFLRLTDLGISRQIREDNHQDTSGTPGYMAPEVMMKKSHSFAVDYFALGVIAYELMLGKRPYQGANRKQIKEQMLARQVSVKFDELPFKWSPHSIDFINKLLLRNPEKRLGSNGIDELKQHPWLVDIQWEKMLNKKVKSPFRPLSIEDDYQNYKDQISEDTIVQNEQEIFMLLRKNQTQELFEDYDYQKKSIETHKRNTSHTTNNTEENFGRR